MVYGKWVKVGKKSRKTVTSNLSIYCKPGTREQRELTHQRVIATQRCCTIYCFNNLISEMHANTNWFR